MTTSEQLIARDRELGALLEAIESPDDAPRAIVLEGEAGVGKTALWRRALDVAAERGWRILSSAPAGPEARLVGAAIMSPLSALGEEARS